MSLQRYLALYRGQYGAEYVLPFDEDNERLYERLSEPKRVEFKPRIPDKIREAVMALDDKMRKLQDEIQRLQVERVACLKGEVS